MRMLGARPPPQPPLTYNHHEPISSATTFDLWRRVNLPASDSPTEPWLTALVLVTFDLELGQLVEAVHPPEALSRSEQEAVCFHALPDSAAGGTGREDSMYSFRVVRSATHQLLLAHVLFRQAPDPDNARGAFQKALVLVSSIPCLQLHVTLLKALAPQAFVRGGTVLEEAVRDVQRWGNPRGGERELRLRFCGTALDVSFPHSFLRSFAAPRVVLHGKYDDSLQGSPKAVNMCTENGEENALMRRHTATLLPDVVRTCPLVDPLANPNAAPFHEVHLARALRGVTEKIWTLWELVVLGEPVLVFGSTPPQCAAAVLAIVGLIHPLPFVGDWRPYFCLQDAQYSLLSKARHVRDACPNGAVYGVTNNLMVCTLAFPHVLTLPGCDGVGKTDKAGLETDHRSSLQKPKQVLTALSAAASNSTKKEKRSPVQVAVDVRSCIYERITRPFLRAFDRYLVPTWGNGKAVTSEPYASDPFGRKLSLVELNLDDFPTADDLASPGVTALFKSGAMSKNRVKTLYARFAAGPVFRAWWKEARAAAERECVVLHRTDLIEACVREMGNVTKQTSKNECEDTEKVDRIVEVCTRIKDELKDAAEDDFELRSKLWSLIESLSAPIAEDKKSELGLLTS